MLKLKYLKCKTQDTTFHLLLNNYEQSYWVENQL